MSIKLERIGKSFGKQKVLKGVSLEARQGEIMAILGVSGAGKTTLLRVIAGLEKPQEGRVFIGNELATEGEKILIPPHRRRLGFIFQNLGLWEHMTVEEHLIFVWKTLARPWDTGKIEGILGFLDLLPHRKKKPYQLSGGERQRLAFARALAQEPEFLLMDEPLANLDVMRKRKLREEILKIKKRGIGILYVTHDPWDVRALSDRIAVLHEGKILQEGNLEQLSSRPSHPIVKELLNDNFDL